MPDHSLWSRGRLAPLMGGLRLPLFLIGTVAILSGALKARERTRAYYGGVGMGLVEILVGVVCIGGGDAGPDPGRRHRRRRRGHGRPHPAIAGGRTTDYLVAPTTIHGKVPCTE